MDTRSLLYGLQKFTNSTAAYALTLNIVNSPSCEGEEYAVYKCIVCTRSDFFTKD